MRADDLVGGAGLAADDIARRVDHLAGPVLDDEPEELAICADVSGEITRRPGGASPGRSFSSVAWCRTPPLTSAAAAVATCSGVSEMPWPKPMVMTLTSRHFAGKCGLPTSLISIAGEVSSPNRRRYSCWRVAPTASAILASPIFDEYIKISGTVSRRRLGW